MLRAAITTMCLIMLGTPVSAHVRHHHRHHAHFRDRGIDHHHGRYRREAAGISYQAKARTGCMRPEIWSVLHRLVNRIGPIEVTSGCDGRHTRHSLHYDGRAADIRAKYVSQSAAVAVLRRMPGVGGIGVEGRGLIHVDTGGPIEWHDIRVGGRHHRYHHHRHLRRHRY